MRKYTVNSTTVEVEKVILSYNYCYLYVVCINIFDPRNLGLMRLILTVFLLIAAYRLILAQPNPIPVPHPTTGQSISGQVGLLGPALFYNRTLSHSHRLSGRIGGRYVA